MEPFVSSAHVYMYVRRKAWIWTIHRLCCAKHGSALCAANPPIVPHMILIMCIAVSRHVVGTVCSEIVRSVPAREVFEG